MHHRCACRRGGGRGKPHRPIFPASPAQPHPPAGLSLFSTQSRQAFVVFGAFVQCESRAARQDSGDDIFYRPEARSDPRLPVSVGTMTPVIVWRRAERSARRLFSSAFSRAEAARGRGARNEKRHRADPSRSAARDGAMAEHTTRSADEGRAANRPPSPHAASGWASASASVPVSTSPSTSLSSSAGSPHAVSASTIASRSAPQRACARTLPTPPRTV